MTNRDKIWKAAKDAARAFNAAIKAAGIKPLPNHEGWSRDIEEKYFEMLRLEKIMRNEFRVA